MTLKCLENITYRAIKLFITCVQGKLASNNTGALSF